jgi:hypothetical protein
MTERKATAKADYRREWKKERQRQKQITGGNGRKKGKSKSRLGGVRWGGS